MALSTFTVFKHINNLNKDMTPLTGKKLRKLQDVLKSIVSDFDNTCRKHDIKYCAGGGTALGAVRHHDMIPWDDDVDLNMTRKDYDAFRRIFEKELGDQYILQTPESTKDYGLGMARLRKKGTVFKTREDKDKPDNECGIYVDIFVFENVYNIMPLRCIQGFLSLAFGFLLSCRVFYKNRDINLMLAGDNKETVKIFKKKIRIGKVISFLPVDFLTHSWNNVNKICRNDRSRYVTFASGRLHFFGELYERSRVCETIDMKFGNMLIPVSRDYDYYLSRLYGDYHKIPDVNDRETHVVFKIDFGSDEVVN